MTKAFYQISDCVHVSTSQVNCTRILITKEWLGFYARNSFSPSEWEEITNKLRQDGYIQEEETKQS